MEILVLDSVSILVAYILIAVLFTLAQITYAMRQGFYRPAFFMAAGNFSLILLCVLFLVQSYQNVEYSYLSVLLLSVSGYLTYRSISGLFGRMAAQPIDTILFAGIQITNLFSIGFLSYSLNRIFIATLFVYYFGKLLLVVFAHTRSSSNAGITFITSYLLLYVGLQIAQPVFLILPDSTLKTAIIRGFGSSLFTLIVLGLFILRNLALFIIASMQTEDARKYAYEETLSQRDFATRLVSIIGHDLAGYLSGIRQASELMKTMKDESGIVIDDGEKEIFGIIAANAGKAQHLLQDLVYWGRAHIEKAAPLSSNNGERTAGPGNDTKQDMDFGTLSSVVQKSVEDMRERARIKQVAIEAGRPSTPDIVHLEPTAARVVMRNILSNAIKFSPPGENIHIDYIQKDKKFAVRISDKGPGIPQDILYSIKEGRLLKSQNGSVGEKGTGTGLRIVTSICGSYDWDIDIQPNQPQGTAFSVWFQTPGVDRAYADKG